MDLPGTFALLTAARDKTRKVMTRCILYLLCVLLLSASQIKSAYREECVLFAYVHMSGWTNTNTPHNDEKPRDKVANT